MKGLFITATGTDVGKTMITGAIAAACKGRGIHIGVFKPLASGAVRDKAGQLVSEDASFLMKAAGIGESERGIVNEICLEPALTPAVAAKASGVAINMEQVIENMLHNAQSYDAVLIEGVGGLTAPLWENYLVADLMERLCLPSLLVGDAGLGGINHIVLSEAYARSRQLGLYGIILNRWPADAGLLETSNVEYIRELTKLPILGKMPLSSELNVQELSQPNLALTAEKSLAMDEIIACMMGEKK